MTPKPANLRDTPSLADVASRDQTDLGGQTLGDFHLLRRLGEGGMGQVYLAEQVSLKRRVALKLLRHELANNEVSRKRFEAEALAVARLTHANIVQVYAVGDHAGLHYMALEYVDGRNLRDYLARKGPPELPLALSIMRQVAAALHRAAEMGIIHRDIKPENILLTRKAEVKVADFGLSRIIGQGQPALNLTQTGTALGTPLYMSPEQVEGKPLDHRTDIYSFGVTCYHMLAGQPPFEGENAFAVAIKHVQDEPVPLEAIRPDLPRELCAIVAKMMAKKPDDRYATAREIVRDLKHVGEMLGEAKTQAAAGGSPTPASGNRETPVSPTATPATALAATLRVATLQVKKRRRVYLRAAIGTGLVLASVLLAAAAGGLLARHMHPPPSAEEAEFDGLRPDAQPSHEREAELLSIIRSTEKGGERLQLGISSRVELGLHYLGQRLLDKAENFFNGQSQSSVEQYKLLGTAGQGIVLAFQDKPHESNEQFLDFQTKWIKTPNVKRLELIRYPKLAAMIGKALDYNYLNYDPQKRAEFPKELEKLRRPTGFMPPLPRDKPEKTGP